MYADSISKLLKSIINKIIPKEEYPSKMYFMTIDLISLITGHSLENNKGFFEAGVHQYSVNEPYGDFFSRGRRSRI